MRAPALLLSLALLASLVGCSEATDTPTPTKDGASEMPAVASIAGKGDWRTSYYTDYRGQIALGDTTYDTYAPAYPNYYNGYELQLSAGDEVTVRVGEADGLFDSVIGLYGPKGVDGDWGDVLAANDDSPYGGTFDSLLSFTTPADGAYLVLVREYDWYAGDLYVAATCDGGPCASNQCAPVLCELYCEDGFARDENGCEICACAQPDVCPTSEPTHEICPQVIAWGRNPDTGDCCQYPTPCHVPTDWETTYSEEACLAGDPAAEGEACSMYGTACADGLECEYVCPDGSTDPNCNLGINPSGTCVATTPAECQTDADCVVTGCSGQVCAPDQVFTTCEWRPEYACYQQHGSCGCNAGSCGWADTSDLSQCLGN